MNLKTNIKH